MISRKITTDIIRNIFLFFLLFLLVSVSFSTSCVEVASGSVLLLFVILAGIDPRNSLRKSYADLFVFLYLIVALQSVFRSPFIDQSLRAFFSKACQASAVYFVFRNYIACHKDKMKYVYAAMIITGIIIAADGFFQYIYGWDFIRGFKPDVFFGESEALRTVRITASMKHPNALGIYIASVIPFAAASSFMVKGLWKKTALISTVIMLAGALLLTYSRSAWLAFFISMSILFFVTKKKKTVYLLILFMICLFIMPKTSTFIRSVEPGTFIDDSARSRIAHAKDAVDLIKRNVLFGNGLNTYDRLNKKIHPGREMYYYAHNSYLQMWAELGLAGLLMFLGFLTVLIRNFIVFIKKRRDGPERILYMYASGIFASIVALLITALFDSTLYVSSLSVLFWCLCGMLIGIVSDEGALNNRKASTRPAPTGN